MCGCLQSPEERIKPQEQELETGGCETSNWVLGRRTRSSGRAEVLMATRLWFKHGSYLIAFFLFYQCLLRVKFDFSVFLDYDGYEVLDVNFENTILNLLLIVTVAVPLVFLSKSVTTCQFCLIQQVQASGIEIIRWTPYRTLKLQPAHTSKLLIPELSNDKQLDGLAIF